MQAALDSTMPACQMSTASKASDSKADEYDETELDSEWLELLKEVDVSLKLHKKEPIKSSRCGTCHPENSSFFWLVR